MPSRPLSRPTAEIVAPLERDLVGVIARRNPRRSRRVIETAGKVAAVLGDAALRLSAVQQRRLIANRNEVSALLEAVLERLGPSTKPGNRSASAIRADDDNRGEGLGDRLDMAEGRRRLKAYATPTPVEDWAGAVAGPTVLERTHGIARSTLHEWQKAGAVIGLLIGLRKHVFPVAQFVDGRPVEGLQAIVVAAGSARTAWAWLVEPHPSLGRRSPLELLRAGRSTVVADLANRDFAQS